MADNKKKPTHNIEESMANAFKKAGAKAHLHLSKLVPYKGKIYDEDEDEDEGGGEGGKTISTTRGFSQADWDTIEAGNEALQKMLMAYEKEFGEVSKDRRGRPSKEQSAGLQQLSGLPHHPLLSNTQRFDGMAPSESPEATINPDVTQILEEHLESNPELVNNPQLRAALEHRKQMKAQMAHTRTPTFDRH